MTALGAHVRQRGRADARACERGIREPKACLRAARSRAPDAPYDSMRRRLCDRRHARSRRWTCAQGADPGDCFRPGRAIEVAPASATKELAPIFLVGEHGRRREMGSLRGRDIAVARSQMLPRAALSIGLARYGTLLTWWPFSPISRRSEPPLNATS